MPKQPPPRLPQLGEVQSGIRPNPFSKAQLIEAQLAKIDIAQAELFRTLKPRPLASDTRPLPEPHSRCPGEAEPAPAIVEREPPQQAELEILGNPSVSTPPPNSKRSSSNLPVADKDVKKAHEETSPHFLGHRERLRDRFLKGGTEGLADYELLELVLFRALPRRDVKPLAKDLITKFGSFAQVVAARQERLQETPGLGTAAITEIKIIEAAARRLAKSNIEKRPSMGSFTAVVDYCRTAMAFLDHEEFRVLFLDKKNFLIADEVQGIGTVDHAPVYTREIIRRALELSASAIILVHNHPSGDPQPSTEDIYLTHQIIDIAKKLNVAVHDHLIIGKHGHASLKGMRII